MKIKYFAVTKQNEIVTYILNCNNIHDYFQVRKQIEEF